MGSFNRKVPLKNFPPSNSVFMKPLPMASQDRRRRRQLQRGRAGYNSPQQQLVWSAGAMILLSSGTGRRRGGGGGQWKCRRVDADVWLDDADILGPQ